ncbi:GNAT family N-acetyltransferase [Micromonospora sp. AMSO12t]|uniref:GNAT family N-acetyltransferase n=1 Tax=unclassified Micromonospora TaxID=2617518 RepID=UPI00124B18A1|nr:MULTISPECIES: GNAT family N-acetyltransferase [unclassified Micromonospora]KAB1161942.1 GNAT family N-acetyltransferase [Micromonospora sp. AMSO12t]WSG00707.1 GNAT family N-acetyltransferase [Micromonospora sp. NBC_01740]
MDTADLAARLACVRRTWTPQQRLHVGNVAWSHAHGDGSAAPDRTLAWCRPLLGFADIWLPASAEEPANASLHLSPRTMTPRQLVDALDELRQVAPRVSLEVPLQQTELIDALSARGFVESGGPWFAQLWRSLADLSDLEAHTVPDGYSIRAVRPDELAARVEVHRRCWDPARIRRMLGLPVTGDEGSSSYSIDRHLAVTATPVYRGELDMVAVAADGSLAAFGLGWLDAESGSVLFEPVGTGPHHAGRGLGRAVCAEILRAARDLGATQAVVGPRGDGGYPVPRRLYEGLRMREVAQVVRFATA